jgi:hypothetical protein
MAAASAAVIPTKEEEGLQRTGMKLRNLNRSGRRVEDRPPVETRPLRGNSVFPLSGAVRMTTAHIRAVTLNFGYAKIIIIERRVESDSHTDCVQLSMYRQSCHRYVPPW